MHECLQKFCWGRVFLAALIYVGIFAILQWLSLLVNANYYMMPEYFGVWNKTMMPRLGLPPYQFTMTSLAFAFLSGFVLATFYAFIKGAFEKCFCKQVSGFTILVSIILLIFTYIPMLMLFNLPFLLVMSWFIVSMLSVFFASMAFAKLLK